LFKIPPVGVVGSETDSVVKTESASYPVNFTQVWWGLVRDIFPGFVDKPRTVKCYRGSVINPVEAVADKLLAIHNNPIGIAMAMNYRAFINIDPAICGGEPVVRGTRV